MKSFSQNSFSLLSYSAFTEHYGKMHKFFSASFASFALNVVCIGSNKLETMDNSMEALSRTAEVFWSVFRRGFFIDFGEESG